SANSDPAPADAAGGADNGGPLAGWKAGQGNSSAEIEDRTTLGTASSGTGSLLRGDGAGGSQLVGGGSGSLPRGRGTRCRRDFSDAAGTRLAKTEKGTPLVDTGGRRRAHIPVSCAGRFDLFFHSRNPPRRGYGVIYVVIIGAGE